MIPFESANYFTELGKVKMKVYRNGEIEVVDPDPLPYCFAPSKNEIQTQARMERTDFKAFDTGESVKRYTFPMPQNVKTFRNFQEAKSISVYEADKKYVGVWMLDGDLVCSDYPNEAAWDTEEDDSGVKPDAETANVPITAVGIIYKGQKYAWAGQEKATLQGAVDFIKENKISLLKGWNSKFWDVPFFMRRLAYNNVQFDYNSVRFLDLSLAYRFMEKNFRSQWSLEKVGKRFFDMKKPFTNTRLSSLPLEQLKERVLWDAEVTEMIDSAKNLVTNAPKDYSKVCIQMAKQGHIFPDQIFGVHPEKKTITVTPVLDQYFLKYAHKLGYVLPCKSGYNQRPKYKGAWVEVYERGFFNDVLQFDVDSLYPNVILAYRLAPQGRFDLIEPIVRDLLAGKRNAKDKVERWAYKISVNALYGIFASTYYRFKAVEVSDQTCFHGRDILTHTAEFLRSLGYSVYYMDTDSIFVHGTWEERETIHNLINDFVRQTYNVDNIKFGLENYWKTIGFPRSTKGEKVAKKYYGTVGRDKTGAEVNKFEEAGMETLRGDWTELAQMLQDTLKKMQINGVPKEKMLNFYEITKVNLYKGLYDPLLVLEKHMSRSVETYGGVKKDKNGKERRMPIPQHVKAFKNALETGWVPNDMIQYGIVQYYMTRGMIPKLTNLTKADEIDYQWYCSRQIDPIVWRLGIIEAITKYKKERGEKTKQTTL